MSDENSAKPRHKAKNAERLAAKLRENLHRRKAQAREMSAGEDCGTSTLPKTGAPS